MVQHDPDGNIVFLHRNTYKVEGKVEHPPLIWDHIQQFSKDMADENYDVRGANGGEVFPDFHRYQIDIYNA
jgi:alpha 1,2-mannosyltransferase